MDLHPSPSPQTDPSASYEVPTAVPAAWLGGGGSATQTVRVADLFGDDEDDERSLYNVEEKIRQEKYRHILEYSKRYSKLESKYGHLDRQLKDHTIFEKEE